MDTLVILWGKSSIACFAYVLSLFTVCVWCTIWYVNRSKAFLMHWQQELQYIWMYPNNAKQPLLRSCWCSFARIWQIVMQGRGVVVFVGCRFSTAVSAGFVQYFCSICASFVQYLWSTVFVGCRFCRQRGANIQLNSEAFANLRLEFKAQVFGLSWRIFKWENYIYTHSIYNIESLEYPKFCTILLFNEVRYFDIQTHFISLWGVSKMQF